MNNTILIIDNYDSFVYNLARYFECTGWQPIVCRNDALTIVEVLRLQPAAIIISPGPGTPNDSGICLEILQHTPTLCPILGVCLGHQAIGQVFGANVGPARHPLHGKASNITHTQQGLFHGLPQPLMVARYHSLIVQPSPWPSCLQATAHCSAGEIMALCHRERPIFGVQFHPESILTPQGMGIIRNFSETVRAWQQQHAHACSA